MTEKSTQHTMDELAKECLKIFDVEYEELPREVYSLDGRKIQATTFMFGITEAPFGNQKIPMRIRLDAIEDGFLIFRSIPVLPSEWDTKVFMEAVKSNVATTNVGSFCLTPDSDEVSFSHGVCFPPKPLQENFSSCAEIAVINMVVTIDAWHSVDSVVEMFSCRRFENAASTLH